MADQRIDILLALKTQLEGHTEALGYLKDFASGLTGVGLTLGVSALGSGLAALAKSSMEVGQELTIMASRAEMSTAAMQTLWLTSVSYGVEQQDLVRGSVNLQKNLETAATHGASPFNKALAELHLTAAGLQALAPERQFEVIGEKIANATDKHAAFNAALDLLGTKSAPKLLEFLKQLGVEGYDRMAASVKGIALTEEQLATLDRGAQHFERMWLAVKLIVASGFANSIDLMSASVPAIIAAQQRMEAAEKAATEKKSGNAWGGANVERDLARAAFVREAAKIDDQNYTALAKATLKKMRADGGRFGNPADLAALQKPFDDRTAGRADNAAKMAAGDAAHAGVYTDEDAKNAAVREKENEAVNARIDAALKHRNDSYQQLAETVKKVADPMEKYRQELQRIDALRNTYDVNGKPFLTDAEATDAIKRTNAAMAKLTFDLAGGFTPAIDQAHAALLEYQDTLNELSNDPFLTDQEKHAQRIETLKLENLEIEHRVKLLQDEMKFHSAADNKPAQHEIDSLSKTQVGNKKQIGTFDSGTASMAKNLKKDFTDLQNQIKSPAQNIAHTISGTIGDAFKSVQDNMTGLIMGTESWHDALANVARTIETDLVSGIVKMFTEWIEQRALKALADMGWTAAEGEADVAALGPGALLASISSWGVASLVGVAALVGAMTMFSEGGFTGDAMGVVHPGEFVFSAPAVANLGLDPLIAMHDSAKGGGSLAASAASGSSSRRQRQQRVIVEHSMAAAATRHLLQHPDFENTVARIVVRRFGFPA